MARIRSIKPETFQDQDFALELPDRDARLLYIGLWGLSDEHGRLRGDAVFIKGQLFAYDPDLTPEAIDGLIDMLVATGRAVRYKVRSSVYLFLSKLAQHQRLEPQKVPSRLPEPPADLLEPSNIDSFENFPDESAPLANESAPRQAAGSREHVAGSSARDPEPLTALPAGAEQAARLVQDAADASPELAVEVVLTIARERKPRNLPGLVRRIIDAGELGEWLSKAQQAIASEKVKTSLAQARASPECVHGQPGGENLHPVSGKPLCPLCRKGVPP